MIDVYQLSRGAFYDCTTPKIGTQTLVSKGVCCTRVSYSLLKCMQSPAVLCSSYDTEHAVWVIRHFDALILMHLASCSIKHIETMIVTIAQLLLMASCVSAQLTSWRFDSLHPLPH